MPTGRWVDKEAVVHVHSGVLLSHIKECTWVSSNHVDEPRAYYTEWIQSEREKYCILIYTVIHKILYIAYIWNLERQYQWPYMQSSKEDRLLDSARESKSGMIWNMYIQSFQSVQSLSRVRLFATPRTAAHQASLSITNSWSLLKLISIESVVPSNHLILCCPLLPLLSFFPSIRVFSNESVLCIRWPKYWSFSLKTPPLNMYITICKTGEPCKFNAWSRAPKASVLGQPRGIEWGGRRVQDGGPHVLTCGQFTLMHGKNHHNIVK